MGGDFFVKYDVILRTYFTELKTFLGLLLSLISVLASSQQYISVASKTPDELVRDVLVGSENASCITISNVPAKGWQDYGLNPFSYGYFEKGTLPFSIEKGIILSTGNLYNTPGPNRSILSDGRSNWVTDPDLERIFGTDYHNATVLEFDFVTYENTGISFDYLFLSEEYNAGNCTYSDAFAFLIKKADEPAIEYENIAVVPQTNIPVSSLTIKGGSDCPRNENYFDTFNYGADQDPLLSPTNFNGQTKLLTAKADVILGQKYHIKLVIADHKNSQYDSAVFLKAGSFVGKKDLGADLLVSNNNAQCEGYSFTIDASTPGATSYQWYKDGTLLPGENKDKLVIPGTSSDAGNYEVEISLSGCKLKGSKRIEFTEKPVLLTKSFCNYNNGQPIPIQLSDYDSQIISNYKSFFIVEYYADEFYTQKLPNNWSYTNDTKVYVRALSGSCDPVKGVIEFTAPKNSTILQDKTICANSTTILTAENTFKYYKWIREDGQIIAEGSATNSVTNIPVGKYIVELTSQNDCKLQQNITVSESVSPQISHVDVTGSTATVNVSGGVAPYVYSIDGVNFQSSNVFTNVPRGKHQIFVKDSQNCKVIQSEFLIVNILNVITPNGDGINDVLNYSDLKIKENPTMQIFNRDGTKVFQSENQNYIWNGKIGGRALPSGTYWYVLTWTEPVTLIPVLHRGWILLKNRD